MTGALLDMNIVNKHNCHPGATAGSEGSHKVLFSGDISHSLNMTVVFIK